MSRPGRWRRCRAGLRGVEGDLEHLRADPELVSGLGEPLLGGSTFDLDLAQPGADLLARQRVILSEVEQLLLTDGQLGQLLAVAVM